MILTVKAMLLFLLGRSMLQFKMYIFLIKCVSLDYSSELLVEVIRVTVLIY